ncbi:unnamed protein product [Meloidogyne enterolobii]|uniref:Uncharacterized protein n=1 Tax=Meloidogyne enterolobii TaxID=390850 RepID=A0ACB0Y3D1_MELEN
MCYSRWPFFSFCCRLVIIPLNACYRSYVPGGDCGSYWERRSLSGLVHLFFPH